VWVPLGLAGGVQSGVTVTFNSKGRVSSVRAGTVRTGPAAGRWLGGRPWLAASVLLVRQAERLPYKQRRHRVIPSLNIRLYSRLSVRMLRRRFVNLGKV
jgi:hypothetical protein